MRNILLFKDLFFLRVSVVKKGNPYSKFNSHRSDEYILLNGVSIQINEERREESTFFRRTLKCKFNKAQRIQNEINCVTLEHHM